MSASNKPPTTKELKHLDRKCNHCYVNGREKQLSGCSRCRSQYYCSKECQKADWKNHKPRCNNNSLLESVLKAHEHVFAGHYPALVDGISLYELDQRLERWVRFHNPLLMAVTIQALGLQHSVARARTALLHIRLAARPRAEHRDAPARYFRVRDAAVVSVAHALGREAPWPESVRQLLAMADEGERGGRGTVAGALVECPPLAVQTVPFGSLSARVLRGEPTVEAWKELLVDHVEEGVRLRVVRK